MARRKPVSNSADTTDMAFVPSGIQAKLDRAEEHFNLLDRLVDEYLRENAYRFVGEERTEAGYWHYEAYLEVDSFPPDEVWGPIIGDIVHNLRSALDHLAWQLALPEYRAEAPRRISFPVVFEDPTKNQSTADYLERKLDCLREDSRPLIDRAQPYRFPDINHPLWVLEALWNVDKHRMLHTTGFAFGEPSDDPNSIGFLSWSWGPFNRDTTKPILRRI